MLTSVFLLTYTASAVNKSGHKYFSSEMLLVITSIRSCGVGAFSQSSNFYISLSSWSVCTLTILTWPLSFLHLHSKAVLSASYFLLSFVGFTINSCTSIAVISLLSNFSLLLITPHAWKNHVLGWEVQNGGSSSFRVICLRFRLIMAGSFFPPLTIVHRFPFRG